MRIHILGVGGTFMGSLAILAQQMGHEVTGVDEVMYDPMLSALTDHDIATSTYDNDSWLKQDDLDVVIIGNVLSRGHPAVEWVLNHKLAYTSGPAWLAQHVLKTRRVIAVAGTHGKTTTSTIIAWLMTQMGMNPGYLIGGIPHDLPSQVALGTSPWFVIEADEYDTAFFDKRAKFIHYCPEILVINNLEFDHADIYPDLAAIETQFGYLLRTVPSQGHLIYPYGFPRIEALLDIHPWAELHSFGDDKADLLLKQQGNQNHRIYYQGQSYCSSWQLIGEHNRHNYQAALLALACTGESLAQHPDMGTITGVKRRLEKHYGDEKFSIYHDFGHHPTAVAMTLTALQQQFPHHHLCAVIHMASNSMHSGAHDQAMSKVLTMANQTYLLCDNPTVKQRVVQWAQHPAVTVIDNPLELSMITIDKTKKTLVIVFSNKAVNPILKVLTPA